MDCVLRVNFGIHVAENDIASMVSGIGAYGLVRRDESDSRSYTVTTVRSGKAAGLKKQLASWESYGFLRWREISDPG
jgi:hypothetical protein